MADSGTNSIDRLFDFVDDAVDKVDRVLNRTKQTENLHRTRNAKSPEIIDATAEEKVKKTSSSTTLATRRYRIVEAIAADTGVTLFVVTNGRERAECNSREVAEKILAMLEAAP